ncbi:hypothetical protein V6N11_047204 [Hibiscus sabdariffa]|uniref:Uncharacterized protein n=1 Tax=Hibiscus sabdariffa TaxID=183260 RepID=A0ABR2AAZ7_9ROSI
MFPSFMLQVKTMIPLFPSIMFQIKTMLPLFSSIMFQVKRMINMFPSILFQIKTLLRGVERGRSLHREANVQLKLATSKGVKKSAAPEGDNKSTTRVAPMSGGAAPFQVVRARLRLASNMGGAGGGWAGSNVGGAGKRKFHESGAGWEKYSVYKCEKRMVKFEACLKK